MRIHQLRGLLTDDGELDYSQHWEYAFNPSRGVFMAGLFDDVADGEWWAGTWYPFDDPRVPIEAYVVDTLEELEETITGAEIPAEVLATLREEQRRYCTGAAAAG